MDMVKSVSYDQTEIINWILDLHVPSNHIDCYPTSSKGNFYNNTGIEHPQYIFYILSQVDVVEYVDSRSLQLTDD